MNDSDRASVATTMDEATVCLNEVTMCLNEATVCLNEATVCTVDEATVWTVYGGCML